MVIRNIFLLLVASLLLGSVDAMWQKRILIEADLFTKILLLDFDLKDKLINQSIHISVLYDTPEHRTMAQAFVKALDGKHYMQWPIQSTIQPLDAPLQCKASGYIAVLKSESLQAIAPTIARCRRLLFVYDDRLIQNGMISVAFGLRVTPIINPYWLKKADVQLHAVIFDLAKVCDYEQ